VCRKHFWYAGFFKNEEFGINSDGYFRNQQSVWLRSWLNEPFDEVTPLTVRENVRYNDLYRQRRPPQKENGR